MEFLKRYALVEVGGVVVVVKGVVLGRVFADIDALAAKRWAASLTRPPPVDDACAKALFSPLDASGRRPLVRVAVVVGRPSLGHRSVSVVVESGESEKDRGLI